MVGLVIHGVHGATIGNVGLAVYPAGDDWTASVRVELLDVQAAEELSVCIELETLQGERELLQEDAPLQRAGNRIFAVGAFSIQPEWMWYPERPQRYRLRVILAGPGDQAAQMEQQVVFRSIVVTDDGSVLLNGKPFTPVLDSYVPADESPGERIRNLHAIRNDGFHGIVLGSDESDFPIEDADHIGLLVFSRADEGFVQLHLPEQGADALSSLEIRLPEENKPAPPVFFPHSTIMVPENPRIVEVPVENRFMLRSLDELNCTWMWLKNGAIQEEGTQHIFLQAGQTMVAGFSPPRSGLAGGMHVLRLGFFENDGTRVAEQDLWIRTPTWKEEFLLLQDGMQFDEAWQVTADATELVADHSHFVFRYSLEQSEWFCHTHERNIRLLDSPIKYFFPEYPGKATTWRHLEKESVPETEATRFSSLMRGLLDDGTTTNEFVQVDTFLSPFGYIDYEITNRMSGEKGRLSPGISFSLPSHLNTLSGVAIHPDYPLRWSFPDTRINSASVELRDSYSLRIEDDRGYGFILFGWGLQISIKPGQAGNQFAITASGEESDSSAHPLIDRKTNSLRFRIIPFTPDPSRRVIMGM